MSKLYSSYVGLSQDKIDEHMHNHFKHTSTTNGDKSLKELAMIMNRKKT
jgi:hypothetical protein